MKYCSNCGSQVNEAAVVCLSCGASVAPVVPVAARPVVYDAPSAGYAFLGFLFPVIGLVLYLVWKDQTPLRAKSAGKGALISVILGVSIYALSFIALLAGGGY